MGSLTLVHLWIVAFATGTLSIFFTIASVAVLPSAVKRSQLVEANSKFGPTDSVLAIAVPSIAGGIIQLLRDPRRLLWMLSHISSQPSPSPVVTGHIGRHIGTALQSPSVIACGFWGFMPLPQVSLVHPYPIWYSGRP